MQYHEFDNSQEFTMWKEKEEATSNAHYILHYPPYVMSLSEMMVKVVNGIQNFSLSIISIRCSTGAPLLCLLPKWYYKPSKQPRKTQKPSRKHEFLGYMLQSLAQAK